ncbi:diguanylate cyclase (GGDEF)-like protein [Rhodobacter aestuarii]|uniref:Diguanylate cyclase (GGDEF) domain-containing protein n=1 Tax=Rhodobacter aestuarii TaxID=453582 RepID=A0A1N7IUL0_9RHOB|nr:diguanylate cyclase (GGDEF)-like protein [Rhodobacter aestuarii]SIS40706.1 diguanylate cyclase (GGDEF) domain-containing protein [Rhodobacter aestuarii]
MPKILAVRQIFRSLIAPIRAVLTRHPSPEDVNSVVSGTAFGAFITALNAVIYVIGAFDKEEVSFLAPWLGAVVVLCAVLSWMSIRSSKRAVRRVSKRTARRLMITSVLLALPWAALPIHVFALHGAGDPHGAGEPMLVMVVSTGMLAGGVLVLHRALTAAVTYMTTILLAVTGSVQIGGWEEAWPITAYCFIYGMFLAYFATSAGDTARQRDESVAALSQAVEGLRAARDENYLLANIDDTTGLLNRKAFNARLAEAVAQQASNGGGFSVLLMDLDRFKNVNDLFGHSVGDELLAEIARRLRANLHEGDVIGRIGGDEFCIILVEAATEAQIKSVAGRLLEALNVPARLAGRQVHPGASIGAVICPDDAADPVELFLKADLALNRAKEAGRGQCVKFDDHLRQQVITNDRIEAGLRDALKDNLLYVQYQPKISLRDGRPMGAEALVRWTLPDGQKVSPEFFLSIAAERGLLPSLSRHIAEAVADHILGWRAEGLNPGKIALNIHPDDIKSPELLMETIQMFESKGITGDDLLLEITEGCLIGRGTDMVSRLLDALADRGYDLSLDDFGTGHAALAHLKKIPVAEIKIDRSFVSGLEVRRDDRAIVAAITEIARGMGIRSVAEGVETQAQCDMLKALGVEVGQGYLWSRPISAESFAAYLAEQQRKVG